MAKTVIKGDVLFQKNPTSFETIKSGYLTIEDGKILSVSEKNKASGDYEFLDFDGKLIVPGLVDTHLHAPQNAFRGTGMDLELIDWLNESAFVEEAKYSDPEYAEKAYEIFTKGLKESATTRACIFATLHKDATVTLMQKLENSGLITYVGKVNMDRNSPDNLTEKCPDRSISDTISVIEATQNLKNTKPILTPRFTPSCSPELMEKLGELQQKYSLPVQSHLSENLGEIELVKSLHPDAEFYAQTYDKYGLFGRSKEGKAVKTVMAHCVWSGEKERELIKKNGVYIAHSPLSNLNLSSGIAPIRRYLNEGLKVTLATDVAGGHTKSMFSVLVSTVQVSKMYWRLVDETLPPITFAEAFYMATAVGGEFFGNVGRFEKGYDADILVLDDEVIPTAEKLSAEKRLERYAYLNGDLRNGGITAKFVKGKRLI